MKELAAKRFKLPKIKKQESKGRKYGMLSFFIDS